MMNEKQAAEILLFLEQYSEFLHEMASDEKEKLAALVSDTLVRIEMAILTAQKNAKQMESMEKKRMALQSENGVDGLSLTELCEATPLTLRARMIALSQKVRGGVEEIRFNNDKSMSVARSNIIHVNPDAVLATVKTDAAHDNPYTRAKEKGQEDVSILITKA